MRRTVLESERHLVEEPDYPSVPGPHQFLRRHLHNLQFSQVPLHTTNRAKDSNGHLYGRDLKRGPQTLRPTLSLDLRGDFYTRPKNTVPICRGRPGQTTGKEKRGLNTVL